MNINQVSNSWFSHDKWPPSAFAGKINLQEIMTGHIFMHNFIFPWSSGVCNLVQVQAKFCWKWSTKPKCCGFLLHLLNIHARKHEHKMLKWTEVLYTRTHTHPGVTNKNKPMTTTTMTTMMLWIKLEILYFAAYYRCIACGLFCSLYGVKMMKQCLVAWCWWWWW